MYKNVWGEVVYVYERMDRKGEWKELGRYDTYEQADSIQMNSHAHNTRVLGLNATGRVVSSTTVNRE